MAELKEKELKILSALSQVTEPARPSRIGKIIGEKPIDVGGFLVELLKAGLAEKTDEERNLWTITDKGVEYLSNLGEQPLSQPHVTETVSQGQRRNHSQRLLSPHNPTFSNPWGKDCASVWAEEESKKALLLPILLKKLRVRN